LGADDHVYRSSVGTLVAEPCLNSENVCIGAGRQGVSGGMGLINHAARPTNLGLKFNRQYHKTGQLSDLEQAIALFREAITRASGDSDTRAICLSNLSAVLLDRFERTGQLADLDEAVILGRQAVATVTRESGQRAPWLNHLGNALWMRFGRFGRLADLDEAVTAYREAVAAEAPSQQSRAKYLQNLSTALNDRFKRTGEMADLEEAVVVGREVVATRPGDPDQRGRRLNALAASLSSRYDRTGQFADLEEYIDLLRQAVEATNGYPGRVRYLYNLSRGLRHRFERTGHLADLDEAIKLGRQAVAATQGNDPARAGRMNELAVSLWRRFSRTGQMADLEEAIVIGRQAIAATPNDHPERAGRLNNQSLFLRLRFVRTGDLTNLEEAVDMGRHAVAATPDDHPRRVGLLNNLASALVSRFGRTGNLVELDEAIDFSRQAVEAASDDHPQHANHQNSLSVGLLNRFGRTGNLADLDEALALSREAVAATPDDHPDRASRLNNLGTVLRRCSEHGSGTVVLGEAAEAFKQAASVATAPTVKRIQSSRSWARMAALTGDWQQALEGFSLAVRLLPQVVPRNLGRADAEHGLGQFSGIAAEAAACALQTGDPSMALQLLEHGRGILFAQAIEARSDVTELRETAPDLAERFIRLRERLDDPSTGGLPGDPAEAAWYADPTANYARAAEARRVLAAEWDNLVAQIRAQPGLTSFLQPPHPLELAADAASGPIVLVNVSNYRSDALILTIDHVDTVPLPELTPVTVRDQVRRLLNALATVHASRSTTGEREQAQQATTAILAWLWDALAGPVLDRLDMTTTPADGQPWPRVWWSLGGLLCYLPVHAAGHHGEKDQPNPRTVLDRTISSYIPTVHALRYARSRRGIPATAADQLLVVAMPHTPGAHNLPGTKYESNLLSQMFGAHVLVDYEATYETVLAQMQSHECIHFACHGEGNWDNPSASQLLLHDHMTHPLTVLDISRLNLAGNRLAYLSACNTTRGNLDLADEAIHITSAFQLAGYSHVIGTLWPIDDAVSVGIAETVYGTITRNHAGKIDVAEAAYALHIATRATRESYPLTPTLWAAYVHVGA
jgi:tetratricopeptide (TPR) repeat protein